MNQCTARAQTGSQNRSQTSAGIYMQPRFTSHFFTIAGANVKQRTMTVYEGAGMPQKLPTTNKNPAVLAVIAKAEAAYPTMSSQAAAVGVGRNVLTDMRRAGYKIGPIVAIKLAEFLGGQYSAQQILDMDGCGVKAKQKPKPPDWAVYNPYLGERKNAPNLPAVASKPTGSQLCCCGCTHNNRHRCDKTLLPATRWCAGYSAGGGR